VFTRSKKNQHSVLKNPQFDSILNQFNPVTYSLASYRGGPDGRAGEVMWDLWWTKWRWGRFSPSTSVSPANLHFTNFSTITIIYHLGLVQ
jgi:hypothetical protein